MTEPQIHSLLAGLLGLLIGSFLNVCIARLPLDYSVVSPRSHCPSCGAGIAWYDNIPVLSWLLLRARCRSCRASISWLYPVVELLTGICFWLAVRQYGLSWQSFRLCLFSALLLELLFSDLDSRILPDEFTLGGWIVGFFLAAVEPLPGSFFQALLPGWNPRAASLLDATVASLFASGILWLMGTVYLRLRGREGLGFGDVKLMGMIGVFLGLQATLIVMVYGSVAGSVLGLLWIKLRRLDLSEYELPFGSFLAAAALWIALSGLP